MPTQVPNSGYIEKVYFNTSKDYESYYNLFEKLDFVEFQGTLGYPILLTEDNKILFIGKVVDDDGVVDHYSLSYLDLVAMNSITHIIVYTENIEKWNDDFITNGSYITINANVVSSMQGMNVGVQNDLLTNLISTTPFEEPIALKPFLEGIADAIREKKKTTELINAQDFRNEILSIKGGLIEVTELPEVGEEDVVYKLIHKNVGTVVPTTGLIENVYLNTSLSIDEVNAILKTIEYIPATNEGEPDIYIVLETLDSLVRIFDYNNGSYAITVGMNVAYVSDESFASAGATFVGWNPDLTNPCVVNQESTFTDDFVSQNDKLTDLFSVTPFEEKKIPSEMYYLYHKSTPVAVPNSGMVEKVYFNTKLSVDEVTSLLEQLTYIKDDGENYFILSNTDATYVLFVLKNNNEYAIFSVDENDNITPYFINMSGTISEKLGVTFTGWNPNVANNILYNNTASSSIGDYTVGAENDKLTNLISITPFSYYEQISGGILEVDNLPTSGEDNYVYKIQSVPTALPYMNVEGVGVINLIEFAYQKDGTHVEVVDIVDSVDNLPTSNIKETVENKMYGYYVRNDNYYMYGPFGDDGEKIWVTLSTLMGMPFACEITNVSEITELNSVYALVSGGDSADYYIYEGGKPTQVPNSGLIEKLYFNTKLSIEEVDNILSQLTYDTYGYAYVVGAYEKGSSYGNIIIVEANAFTEGQIPSGYIIGHMNDITNMASTDFIYMSNQGLVDLALTMGINTKVGWNMETLNLNQTFNGAFGTENDKLINVISTTLYPRWTKISGGGATVKATPEVVPNSGYVERVYLNKSLSFDEVNALVEKANSFVVNELPPIYGVVSNNTFDKLLLTFKLTDHDGTTFNSIHYPNLGNVIWSERDYYNEETNGSITQFKKGWMFEEDYVEINSEVVSAIEGDLAINVGQHNDQLTELFSANGTFVSEMKLDGEYDGTTIFLSNKIVIEPTVVPNSGTVEKVYFNTALSIDEVKAILEKFFTLYDGDTLDNMIWLINIDDFNNSSVTPKKLYWIMPSRDTGDYAIVNALAQVIFKSNSSKWAGGNFVGWNPEFITAEKPYLEINSQVFPIVTENGTETKVGGFNDKIVDLFSLTPFEAKTVNNFNIDIKSMLEEKKLPLSINVNIESEIKLNPVTNIALSSDGLLTWDAPDTTDIADKLESISYVVNVNDTVLLAYTNNINVTNYLLDGSNTISIIVKVTLKSISSDSENTVVQYSPPVYTNIADFTLTATTLNGESGYKVTAYKGSEKEINIPLTNTDGLPILECNTLQVSKITGKGIKKINSFQNNGYIVEIDFPNTIYNTEFTNTFVNCPSLKHVINLNTSNATGIVNIFSSCPALETIPVFDASKILTMTSAFYGCKALKVIPAIDVSNVTNMLGVFSVCQSLKSILMYGMKVSFDISSSTQFEKEDLVIILNNLATLTSTQTLTMGGTNLAKLTDEDKAIATNKGWTLA